ncbi:TetR/AcrR family transcriptional regulator [Tateyamaria armeniaca]|uniref:TetR/AcrR family transcriptional regulator n=1 Tax=Tateyamaria armeniaca TaxID=2518930 RepID=A0ABW8UT02_9RHOB
MGEVVDDRSFNVNTYCMEAPNSSRLDPNAWVRAAYEMFEEGGVSAVRIDPLAKKLGITRGSFYWHFENRAALLRALLDRWVEGETERVIEENERGGGTASDRLRRLLWTCATEDGRLEMGVREWAGGDENAREIVRRVDDRRIAYMADLAREAGAPNSDAKARARIAYVAWLGFYTGIAPTTTEQRIADMDQLHCMMVSS